MITCVLPSLQDPSSATLVFFAHRFVLKPLPVLVFVFLEQVCREWSLVTYAPHLIFSDVLLLSPLGPIAWIGLLFLLVVASCGTGHADVEREVQLAMCGPPPFIAVAGLVDHIDIREWVRVDSHLVLTQDKSALFNSRLNLLAEFVAVFGGVRE
jgi:hypothetical protein